MTHKLADMKLTGLAEQYDSGREIYIQQEGALVQISVEAQQGSNAGTALVTPGQARIIASALLKEASGADEYGKPDDAS